MHDGEALHPNDGETITCRRSSAHGGRFEYEMLLDGSHDAPPMHAHDEIEDVHILEGHLELRLERERKILGPGDRYVIPAGAYHTFRNAEPNERVLGRGIHGAFFEHLMDQFRDGGGFFHLAVALCTPEGRRHYMVRPPIRAVLEVAAVAGRLYGIRPRMP